MSPRAKNFNTGSIIYFEGDKADSVYLLKEGKVNLVYLDVSTREKITDLISTGEFFGVKSGLIKYQREETAKVLENSVLYEFSAQEFESLALKNPKIINKMLKVFSNQLRTITTQIQKLVGEKVSTDAADNFFQIGEYYLKNRKYKPAMTVYQRYINYYPNGKFAKTAQERLKVAKNAFNMYGDEGGPAPLLNGTKASESKEQNLSLDDDFSDLSKDNTSSMEDDQSQDFNLDFGSESSTQENEEETDFTKLNVDNDFEDFTKGSASFDSDDSNAENVEQIDNTNSEEHKIYYKGVSFMNTGKYLDAFNTFKKVLTMKNENVKVLASFEIGKCFFYFEKYKECVDHLTKFLSLHPNFNEKNEVLYFIGLSYSKQKEKPKAERIFKGVLQKTKESDPIYRKIQRALKELG